MDRFRQALGFPPPSSAKLARRVREALTDHGELAAIIVPLLASALLIRQPPRAPVAAAHGPVADDAPPVPLSSNTVVTWMSTAVVFCCFCMSVPLMHLVPLAQDRGISLEDAAKGTQLDERQGR